MTVPNDGVGGASGGIGARLRSARERAGLSPLQAAERLHIDVGALQALETERFEELGAPVYARGYIRHYAELVGESPAGLQDLYAARAEAARMPDLTHIPKADRARPSGTLLLPGVAVVIAVALIGSAWWIAGNLSMGSRPQRGRVASPVHAAPASSLPAAPEVPAAPAAGPAASAAPGVSPRPSASPAPGVALKAAQPRADVPAALPAQHVRAAALKMHFTQDSWTEVYDARGARLFFDVGFAGSTRTVRGVPPLQVVLGNPPEVSLELDGHPVSVPGAPRDVVAKFRIERSGRVAPMRLAAAEKSR